MKKEPLDSPIVFFESIKVDHLEIPYLNEHYERISKLSKAIGSAKFQYSKEQLKEKILTDFIAQNIDSGKCKLILSLIDNIIQIIDVQSEKIDLEIYQDEVVRLTIYPIPKPLHALSQFKQDSRLLYIDSIKYAHKLGAQQSIIINTNDEIVETSICNIYFAQGHILYTPPIESGCVNGIMRQELIYNHKARERTIKRSEIYNFDKIYISNAVRGIQEAILI